MSLVTVRGIYRDGKVELTEPPAGAVESAEVLVTFLPAEPSSAAMREQAFALMEQGIDLGGPPYPTREEIHDERLRELDERRRQKDG